MKPTVSFLAVLFLAHHVVCGETWVLYKIRSSSFDSARVGSLTSLLRRELESAYGSNIIIDPSEPGDIAAERSAALASRNASMGIDCTVRNLLKTNTFHVKKWGAGGMPVITTQVSFPDSSDLDVVVKAIGRLCGPVPNVSRRLDPRPRDSGSHGSQSLFGTGSVVFLGRAGILYPVPSDRFTVLKEESSGYSYSGERPDPADTTVIGGTAYGLEAGLGFNYEKYCIEAAVSFDAARAVYFTVGGAFYLFPENNNTPYVGAGASAGIINKADMQYFNEGEAEKNSDGMALDGRLGLVLMRDSLFKLLIEMRGIVVLNKDLDSGIRVSVGGMLL